jgi:hypothetical protein
MKAPAAIGRASAEEVATFLAKIQRIPDAARDFETTMQDAVEVFRIPKDVIDLIADMGFPNKLSEQGRLFDLNDLKSLMLYLGCGSMGLSMRRLWPTALNSGADSDFARFGITFESACMDAGHGHSCDARFLTPTGYKVAEERTSSGVSRLLVQVDVATRWPELTAPIRQLIDLISNLDFMWLPDRLCNDEEFIRSVGLVDCYSASEMLVRHGMAKGIEIRSAYGLILAPPFCAPHYWAEVMVADRWVPIDPLMIGAMLSWGALKHPPWHIYRSPGSALVRLHSEWKDLSVHNCASARLSFPVRRVT